MFLINYRPTFSIFGSWWLLFTVCVAKQDKIRTGASMAIIKCIRKCNTQSRHIKNKQNNTINNLKHKLKTNNLTTKPDKSNSTIIISQKDLDDNTEEFIVNNNCITLNKDPTNKYQTQITNILRNSCLLYTSRCV